MKKLSHEEIVEICLDTVTHPTHRRYIDINDWGDMETVGLHVKRQGANCMSPWNHFGFYLGIHKVGYVIAIKAILSCRPVSGEAFETIEEMKQRWQLD